MKLSELFDSRHVPGSRPEPGLAERDLSDQLTEELASFAEWSGNTAVVWCATAAGIYRGQRAQDQSADVHWEGTLTPWTSVRGAMTVTATSFGSAEPGTLTVNITEPDFSATLPPADAESFRALNEFGHECMRRQLGWALGVKAD